jgi:hypothetical protein
VRQYVPPYRLTGFFIFIFPSWQIRIN